MPEQRRSPKRKAAARDVAESLAEGLGSIRWDARPSELEARFKLPRRKPGVWHRVGQLHAVAPGIALNGQLRFARGGGVDYLRLFGSAVLPEDAPHLDDSWRDVVGPAIEAWLASLGCVPQPGSLRVGALGDGGEINLVGPGDVAVYVILQREPPVFTIGFIPKAT